MLAAEVFPMQHHIFEKFDQIIALMPSTPSMGESFSIPFKKVLKGHARMVFNPTGAEKAWFTSVFHVENYGVFEQSWFAAPELQPNFSERLRFLIKLLRERRMGVLGFWPWSIIYSRGGALPAAVYAVIRRLQR